MDEKDSVSNPFHKKPEALSTPVISAGIAHDTRASKDIYSAVVNFECRFSTALTEGSYGKSGSALRSDHGNSYPYQDPDIEGPLGIPNSTA